jgi:hypothetical protein
LSKESHRILAELDVDAAMKRRPLGFCPENREIALAGLHKARLMAGGAFTRAQREESREWLRGHEYKVPGRLG